MARIKNTIRSKETASGETKLPQAKFPKPLSGDMKRECSECGKRVAKSNFSRHMKAKHWGVVLAETLGCDGGIPRLKVKLPAVTRRVKSHRELPSTPENEEETHRELAKLYAGRVSTPSTEKRLSYEKTKLLMSVAKDPECLGELKEILAQAGLVLQTREERDEDLADAEARGRMLADETISLRCGDDSSCSVGTDLEGVGVCPSPVQEVPPSLEGSCFSDEVSVKSPRVAVASEGFAANQVLGETAGVQATEKVQMPPLYVTSSFRSGEAQTVTIHVGKKFGIRVTPCLVDEI